MRLLLLVTLLSLGQEAILDACNWWGPAGEPASLEEALEDVYGS
jgi:hypothetical protein